MMKCPICKNKINCDSVTANKEKDFEIFISDEPPTDNEGENGDYYIYKFSNIKNGYDDIFGL